MNNAVSILGWVVATLILFSFALALNFGIIKLGAEAEQKEAIVEQGNDDDQQVTQSARKESEQSTELLQMPQLFSIKRCGKLQDFQSQAWAGVFIDKLSDEYRLSAYKATELYHTYRLRNKIDRMKGQLANMPEIPEDIKERWGKFTKEDIREICIVSDNKNEKDIAVAIVGYEYCSMGALYRFDLQSQKLERVFYPESEKCVNSLDSFKKEIIDGYILPVLSVFGDAGVYRESFMYYDLLHNGLFDASTPYKEASR